MFEIKSTHTYKTIPVSTVWLYLYKEPYPVPVERDEHPDTDSNEVCCQHVQMWVRLLLPAEGKVPLQQFTSHVHYYWVHTCRRAHACMGEGGMTVPRRVWKLAPGAHQRQQKKKKRIFCVQSCCRASIWWAPAGTKGHIQCVHHEIGPLSQWILPCN